MIYQSSMKIKRKKIWKIIFLCLGRLHFDIVKVMQNSLTHEIWRCLPFAIIELVEFFGLTTLKLWKSRNLWWSNGGLCDWVWQIRFLRQRFKGCLVLVGPSFYLVGVFSSSRPLVASPIPPFLIFDDSPRQSSALGFQFRIDSGSPSV